MPEESLPSWLGYRQEKMALIYSSNRRNTTTIIPIHGTWSIPTTRSEGRAHNNNSTPPRSFFVCVLAQIKPPQTNQATTSGSPILFFYFSPFSFPRSTIEHGTSSQYCLFCICVGKFRSPWGLNSGPATKILNPLNTLWMPGLPPTLS